MKTIGLIGGMSWESSLLYYQLINQKVKEQLGGHHSAKSLMYSVDFEEVKKMQHEGNWDQATQIMIDSAMRLERGGGDLIVICANTMHKMAADVQEAISIPHLHIADATAKEILKNNIKKVGLLATAFTMEQDFYKGRLRDKFSLEVLIPNEQERIIVHDVIYQELCLGIINKHSKEAYLKVIKGLVENGAEAIILGCTEITLLISQEDCEVPIIETTKIHAERAVEFALTV